MRSFSKTVSELPVAVMLNTFKQYFAINLATTIESHSLDWMLPRNDSFANVVLQIGYGFRDPFGPRVGPDHFLISGQGAKRAIMSRGTICVTLAQSPSDFFIRLTHREEDFARFEMMLDREMEADERRNQNPVLRTIPRVGDFFVAYIQGSNGAEDVNSVSREDSTAQEVTDAGNLVSRNGGDNPSESVGQHRVTLRESLGKNLSDAENGTNESFHWRRVIVLASSRRGASSSSVNVRVRLIDVGSVRTVGSEQLRPLPDGEAFHETPAFTLRARLSNVRPLTPSSSSSWSRVACEYFSSLVKVEWCKVTYEVKYHQSNQNFNSIFPTPVPSQPRYSSPISTMIPFSA